MIERASIIDVERERNFGLSNREKDHMKRVANISRLICNYLDISEQEKEDIYVAASIHDIGKAYINPKILNKPGKLTYSEMEIMKGHVACSVLQALNEGYNSNVISAIYYHHENYNGTGYYECLKGEEIPLGGRVIKVADVFDALTMDRPYRTKLSIQQAIKIMEDEKEHFDPKIFSILKELYPDDGYI